MNTTELGLSRRNFFLAHRLFLVDEMLLYFEWLAETNGAISSASAQSKFTANDIRDPRVLDGFEIEYLDEAIC